MGTHHGYPRLSVNAALEATYHSFMATHQGHSSRLSRLSHHGHPSRLPITVTDCGCLSQLPLEATLIATHRSYPSWLSNMASWVPIKTNQCDIIATHQHRKTFRTKKKKLIKLWSIRKLRTRHVFPSTYPSSLPSQLPNS